MTLISSSFYHCLFFSIHVMKDDGSVEERHLQEGDLTLLLKWENNQNSYTLCEQ